MHRGGAGDFELLGGQRAAPFLAGELQRAGFGKHFFVGVLPVTPHHVHQLGGRGPNPHPVEVQLRLSGQQIVGIRVDEHGFAGWIGHDLGHQAVVGIVGRKRPVDLNAVVLRRHVRRAGQIDQLGPSISRQADWSSAQDGRGAAWLQRAQAVGKYNAVVVHPGTRRLGGSKQGCVPRYGTLRRAVVDGVGGGQVVDCGNQAVRVVVEPLQPAIDASPDPIARGARRSRGNRKLNLVVGRRGNDHRTRRRAFVPLGVEERNHVFVIPPFQRSGPDVYRTGRVRGRRSHGQRSSVVRIGPGERGIAQHIGLDDTGPVGHVPVGTQRPLEIHVLRGLSHGGRTQGNLQRHQPRRLDLEIVVDAVTQQPLAVDGDQLVLGVGFEQAVARVEGFALFPLDDEKPVALDGQVRRAGADFHGPLGKVGTNLGGFHPQPDLPWVGPPAELCRRRTQRLGLHELRGKQGFGSLESHRVGVADVVAHHVDNRFGGGQPRQRSGQGRLQTHRLPPCSVWPASKGTSTKRYLGTHGCPVHIMAAVSFRPARTGRG